jgi:raffinose/stachyose/melibiose transport system substrate-binding protein
MTEKRVRSRWVVLVILLLITPAVLFATPQSEGAKIILKVWLEAGQPLDQEIQEEIVNGFHSEFPNVQVELTNLSRENMDKILPVSLGAGVGPDVASFDTGDAHLGALARAGLTYDLTGLFRSKGWDRKIYKTLQEAVTYNNKISGVPYGLEAQGLWYNDVIFKKYGMQPPTTWERFIKAAETAKRRGVIPISNTGKQLWHVCQLPANIVYGMIPRDVVYDASTLKGKTTWQDDSRFLEAIRIFQDWAEKGWFLPDPIANDFNEETRVFAAGEAAMTAMGPWMATFAIENAKPGVFEPYFIAMPPKDPSLPLVNHGASAECLFINAMCMEVEAAAEFVDYGWVSDKGNLLWLDKRDRIPATKLDVDIRDIVDDPIMLSIIEAHDAVLADGGLGGIWLDQFVSPEASEVFNYGLQAVLISKKTPEAFIKEISEATIKARKEASQ